MATERRCHNCRAFYPYRLHECPECGTPKHGFNKWLRTAGLNRNLYKNAERAARNA